MRLAVRLLLLPVVLLCPAFAQTYRGLIGAEVEIGEGNRSRAFVDVAKTFRPFENTPTDANGWPTTDFQMLFFDNRPYPAWVAGAPIDDPDKFVPDWSGTYHLSFQGQAAIASAADPATILNHVYDAATNTTTADVSLPSGTALFVLAFTDTRKTGSSAANTGVTDIRLIRPGYPRGTTQVFTDEFLNAMKPYSFLRFMGVLDTNGADPDYPAVKHWSDRRLPADATQQSIGSKRGLAWEYVISLANTAGKDIWINIPVSADDDYVAQLAKLMHDTLRPGVRIYIEHGNEVWNGIFTAYNWNLAAARAERPALNTPPVVQAGWLSVDDEIAQRRHARRVAEMGRIFLNVYGKDAFGTTIRPIYAGWTILPDLYERVLQWVKSSVGEPSTLYYAIAQTHYFNDGAVRVTGAKVSDALQAFRNDSDNGVPMTKAIHDVAAKFNLKHVIYEGGPDTLRSDGTNVAVGSAITACRDSAMKDIVLHDMRDNWFALGGAEFSYFTMSSAFSRWGCWGAVEDALALNTPKYSAILQLTGDSVAPSILPNGIVNAATYAAPIAPGGFASIFGHQFAARSYDWNDWVSGDRLPAAAGGVAVRINGKDCPISYAGPGGSGYDQVNVIVPPDIAPGQATVEVTAPGGTAAQTVDVSAVSPGLFGDLLDGNFHLKALIANSIPPVYVAPANGWAGVQCRPAHEGDYIELYGTGLGVPEHLPFWRVLTRVYPIDASLVSVTIGGEPQTVTFAGMTFAGVFQVNIHVDKLTRSGALPVVVRVAGESSLADAVLTFTKQP